MRKGLKWAAVLALSGVVGFVGAVYAAGSRLVAPVRASVGAPPGDLAMAEVSIAGSRDRHTLLSESRAIFERARQPKQLWVVEGAAHQNFHRYDPKGYRAKVLGFLGRHLGCP